MTKVPRRASPSRRRCSYRPRAGRLSGSVPTQASSQPIALPMREHRREHPPRDALPPIAGGDADLVDIELGRLVGMAMHDRRGLADHHAAVDRHEHVVARLAEVGGKPGRVDRLVEHVVGDAHKQCRIAGRQPPDFDFRHRDDPHSTAANRQRTALQAAKITLTFT